MIVDRVRREGQPALRDYAVQFDGLSADAPLVLGRAELDEALASIDAEDRALLERTGLEAAALDEVEAEVCARLAELAEAPPRRGYFTRTFCEQAR